MLYICFVNYTLEPMQPRNKEPPNKWDIYTKDK